MRKFYFFGLVLIATGCAASHAEDKSWRPPTPAEQADQARQIEVANRPPPAQPDPPPRTDIAKRVRCPQCDDYEAKLADKKRELDAEEVRMNEWAKSHCTGTLKHHVGHDLRGNEVLVGRTESAWICDGQLVDVPITGKYLQLDRSVWYYKRWIKEHCDNAGQNGENKCF